MNLQFWPFNIGFGESLTDGWLHDKFSSETCSQLFLCPLLAGHVLRQYGLECYEQGGALYELRHFLIFTGQTYQLLKPVLGPAWDVLARWEEIRPVRHRVPLLGPVSGHVYLYGLAALGSDSFAGL